MEAIKNLLTSKKGMLKDLVEFEFGVRVYIIRSCQTGLKKLCRVIEKAISSVLCYHTILSISN